LKNTRGEEEEEEDRRRRQRGAVKDVLFGVLFKTVCMMNDDE
jgi:hypothetical protein